MNFTLGKISTSYKILEPEKVRTPRLLVFEKKVDFNIAKIQELVSNIVPSAGLEIIWPHVKTHKSAWTTRKLIRAGIQTFKAMPNEVEMLVKAGAKSIFVAYPLLPQDVDWLSEIRKQNPNVQFFVQVGHKRHVEYLIESSKSTNLKWDYFIDMNVGMDRTGISAESAFDFYRAIPQLNELDFVGLHGYDGHNHEITTDEQDKIAEQSMTRLVAATEQFQNKGVKVQKNVVAGTPSFLADLKYLSRQDYCIETFYSPGTWIYFDTNYDKMIPNTFQVAALILAQIMDLPAPGRATLNLGHKRWGIDQGKIESFSIPGMEALSWSEEHTVVSIPVGEELEIGDYILIAPKHVCSTVNLWEHFTVIDKDGQLKKTNVPVDGRNR
jgi:D-serine deaminase-like pyridoxal phosphate-dependent protein